MARQKVATLSHSCSDSRSCAESVRTCGTPRWCSQTVCWKSGRTAILALSSEDVSEWDASAVREVHIQEKDAEHEGWVVMVVVPGCTYIQLGRTLTAADRHRVTVQ